MGQYKLIYAPCTNYRIYINVDHTNKINKIQFLLNLNLDGVVRHQKMFFPSHEDKVSFAQFFVVEAVRVKRTRILVEGQKFSLKQKNDIMATARLSCTWFQIHVPLKRI
jgi:hypothetical protein